MCRRMILAICTMAFLVLNTAFPGLALGQHRWLAPISVVGILTNGGNYVTFAGRQVLSWDACGPALAKAEPGLGYPSAFGLSSSLTGVLAVDGDLNQCVAFCRMASNIPGSWRWKKNAPPVIFPTGVRNYDIRPGTVIANFGPDGKYSGHCALFIGHRFADSGISVIDQNFGIRCIQWHAIQRTGKGGPTDAMAYWVVEAD